MLFETLLMAFALGFVASRIGLPPLVGYLAAGFALSARGHGGGDAVEAIADLGVLLLLFGIGLKLRPANLARPAVWATAALHAAVATVVVAGALLLAGSVGVPLARDLGPLQTLLIGFALSFSSTVSAVKALEERGETTSLTGRLAIGILVVQDVFAVAYLAFTADEPPSPWAPVLVAAVVGARPAYGWVLSRSGHGELLPLLALALAAGIGAAGFDLVGLKPDLGALVVGATVAGHPRAGELADRILSLKDLLLIGFFLSVGLDGLPGGDAWVIAGVMLLAIPVQALVFLVLLTRFRLRSRTALNTAVTLSTFSEFGLIVAVAAAHAGDLDQVWVSALALAVGGSFVVAAVLLRVRDRLYAAAGPGLLSLERHPLDDEDSVIDIAASRMIVFGMGRIGEGAYDEIVRRQGQVVVGVDRKEELAARHRAAGRNVVRGDALDRDFWERLRFHEDVELIVVALNGHAANVACVAQARRHQPRARVAAIAAYPDEIAELRRAGATVARNLYEEAGQALADDALSLMEGRTDDIPPPRTGTI